MTWGIGGIERRVLRLAESLRTTLRQCAGVTLHDLGARRRGNVTFTVEGVSPEAMVIGLSEPDAEVAGTSPLPLSTAVERGEN